MYLCDLLYLIPTKSFWYRYYYKETGAERGYNVPQSHTTTNKSHHYHFIFYEQRDSKQRGLITAQPIF